MRVYLVADRVIGFGRQSAESMTSTGSAADRVMGLPSPKTMFPPDALNFQSLRHKVESEWVPGMQRLVGVGTERLPVLWDADFLLGARTPAGEDTYVLCEINASCVTPFPPEAPDALALRRSRSARLSWRLRRLRWSEPTCVVRRPDDRLDPPDQRVGRHRPEGSAVDREHPGIAEHEQGVLGHFDGPERLVSPPRPTRARRARHR